MGSFEEEGELQARARPRRAVRSLHVHVPTAQAWRLQVGQGADPGVRHLRRVQAPATILTRATSRPGRSAAAASSSCRRQASRQQWRREFVALRSRSNSSAQSKFSSCARRSAPFRDDTVVLWRKGDSRARVVTTFQRFVGSGSARDSPSCRRGTTTGGQLARGVASRAWMSSRSIVPRSTAL